MTDTFSVAMCTYNGSRFLNEQLASIASQRRLPDELVICDDVSSDDTVAIIQRFRATAPFRVRLEVNSRNLGSTKNFEKTIRLCEGDLIALADQDDVWRPHKLETIEAHFQQEPNVGLVFSDAELVDEHSAPLGTRLWTSIGFDAIMQHQLKHESRLNVLLPGWTVTGATMAFRSKFRLLALPIPEDVPMIHDGWIAAVIGSIAEVSFIEEPLIKYRQHRQQQIGVPHSQMLEQRKRVENVREAIRRTNTYGGLISIGEAVRSRLVECSEVFNSTTALRSLDEHIRHLRTRENLPKSKIKRVPQVLRELVSRRYHLYSRGCASALKDLLTVKTK